MGRKERRTGLKFGLVEELCTEKAREAWVGDIVRRNQDKRTFRLEARTLDGQSERRSGGRPRTWQRASTS